VTRCGGNPSPLPLLAFALVLAGLLETFAVLEGFACGFDVAGAKFALGPSG